MFWTPILHMKEVSILTTRCNLLNSACPRRRLLHMGFSGETGTPVACLQSVLAGALSGLLRGIPCRFG